MKQLIFSATKKDFRVDYFRSSGPGGQGVNKVNSGVRITHIPSGIAVRCTETRDQPENKKRAFRRLSKLVVQWAMSHENKTVHNISDETVRTYHSPDNRVKDHISGLKQTYKEVVGAGDIETMVEARRKAICQK